MGVIRWILGKIILVIETLTKPKSPQLTAEQEQALNRLSQQVTLYQFAACPFCVKVRQASRKLGLPLAVKDAKRDMTARQALEQGGGRIKVPCLRIENTGGDAHWLYESDDIIAYLNQQAAPIMKK
ncbi:glutathione S-transferase N-terminal domain-containing protein [Salinivibrio sp. ES.052]|uniref:glutaredoxin family protein n=1 Tax=Salinivibrio sp. ES.052 TaxID=1882823 RepID=UPI0009268D15|nr:glutathione S-transferase N-terminal domain-containing protein [Salinivibrio sp. ES.052]SIO35819.1 Glutaredoxin [Salinivibrio sp. ES.052]